MIIKFVPQSLVEIARQEYVVGTILLWQLFVAAAINSDSRLVEKT